MYFVGHITGTERFGSKDALLLSGSLRETTMKGSEETGYWLVWNKDVHLISVAGRDWSSL